MFDALKIRTVLAKDLQFRYFPNFQERAYRLHQQNTVANFKIFSFCFTVFVLCWSPYIVFDLLQVYGYIPQTQNNIAIATLIQSLAPLNSAANPVIYCLFSTHLCRNLR